MSPTVTRLPATLGATITGVNLTDLGADDWAVIERAFHAHALLIFPDQHTDEATQVAFAKRFGAIEHLFGDTGIATITNVDAGGDLRRDDDPVMLVLAGNEGWHTDSSYMPVAAKASMLSAHVVPTSGGQTGFVDMRAALDALSAGDRELVERLEAHHSIRWSQERAGLSVDTPSYGYDVLDPPRRPLVKIHPVTGRPALFIGRHAHAIVGLDADESVALLDRLLDEACRPPRTYEHDWRPGDLAVWDNRCVLHRARPYDHREVRVMRHTRIAGDATERAETMGYPPT